MVSTADKLLISKGIQELWRQFLDAHSLDDDKIRDKNTPALLPHMIDVHKIAASENIQVVWIGGGDLDKDMPDSAELGIPTGYSLLDERAALAKRLSDRAVNAATTICSTEDGTHLCASDAVCRMIDLLDSNEVDASDIAAGLLMPEDNFRMWATKFSGDEARLASSYAVPIDMVRRRLDTLDL